MAYNQSIWIGEDVGIAANCCFYPHNYRTEPWQSIRAQGTESDGPIIIGNSTWLGAGVIVLSGVKIGSGVVIGAGAVVTRDIPDGAIAAGVPAHVIRLRGEKVRDSRAPKMFPISETDIR
jgi:acetyltransferase-like isoleucine patch superfamily enzyme